MTFAPGVEMATRSAPEGEEASRRRFWSSCSRSSQVTPGRLGLRWWSSTLRRFLSGEPETGAMGIGQCEVPSRTWVAFSLSEGASGARLLVLHESIVESGK